LGKINEYVEKFGGKINEYMEKFGGKIAIITF
jgi:hypothetical protein